jgi:hypothetical protein
MNEIKRIPREKEDYKALEEYLVKHDLVDDFKCWFAGFDDRSRGAENAVARNVFYGNKNLLVLSVNGADIYLLRNRKDGFAVFHLGTIEDKISVIFHHNLLYPSIEIHLSNDESVYLQATKNKQKVKDFKTLVKNKKR